MAGVPTIARWLNIMPRQVVRFVGEAPGWLWRWSWPASAASEACLVGATAPDAKKTARDLSSGLRRMLQGFRG